MKQLALQASHFFAPPLSLLLIYRKLSCAADLQNIPRLRPLGKFVQRNSEHLFFLILTDRVGSLEPVND